MGSNLVARNVTNPTLTPVLPTRGEETGTAVIVAPGGGFEMLSMTEEGFAVAEWLASRGIAAFVLKYRLNQTPVAVEEWRRSSAEKMKELGEGKGDAPRIPTPVQAVADLEAAIRLVRTQADTWHVDPARVGILGFSAGAMLAIDAGDQEDAGIRPDFIAPIYPPLWSRDIPEYAPPTFLAITLDDRLFTSGGRPLDYLNDLQAADRPFEAHLYQSGGHGFGMEGNGAASALWADEFYAWMEDRSLLVAGSGFNVSATPISELLEDSRARAVMDKFLPGFTENPQTRMAGSISLQKLQTYAPNMINESSLRDIQAELEKL
ncbi:alpha/beta hydrolase [Haliea sp. E17]|uniref:alpha/beta hydrolase n=1 Tax=Haliea sp. E17 TaxID=3401576 RepID=UPI003AAB6EFB